MSSAAMSATTAVTIKTLAGSVSSSNDGIASTFNVSPAISLNVDCASVESGSFGASRQTSLVTDSPSGSDSLATSTRTTVTPAQRSQRLLVRVPSTGVVVVIPASALAFGRHKQRGKPLILCAGFDGVQDAATAVCPDPGNCRHVHADLKLATPFHPHRRSAALLGQYPRMPAGTTEAVLSPDGASVERIPAERMLLTRALEGTRRPIPQCEHFLNAVCNRGSECDFAHVVGAAGPALSSLMQQVPVSPAKGAPKNKAKNKTKHTAPSTHPQHERLLPPCVMPPPAPQPVQYGSPSNDAPRMYQPEPYGHVMPRSCTSAPMPSASSVLSAVRWNAMLGADDLIFRIGSSPGLISSFPYPPRR